MMARKKQKGSINGALKDLTDFYKERNIIRIIAIAGILIFISYYLLIMFDPTFTLRTGILDWGIDQGYTGLIWGILLVLLSLLIVVYPFQKRYRSPEGDRLYKLMITFPLGLAFYLIFFWQFVAHFPFLNFYHTEPFAIADKVTHLLVAFIVTLIAVAYSPRFSTVVIVFLAVTSYELIELVFIVNFSGLYEIHYEVIPLLDVVLEEIQIIFQALVPVAEIEQQLIHELIDIVPDSIANTIGVFLGWLFTRKAIGKRVKQEERAKRRKKKK